MSQWLLLLLFLCVQADRRPLTSFATLHGGKLPPSFDSNNLPPALRSATDYGSTASTEPPERSFMPCDHHESCLYGTSPSTGSIQPFAGQAAGMQNPQRSRDVDSVGSTLPVGPWMGDVGCPSYDTIDYRTAEYSQPVISYTVPPVVVPDTPADMQRPPGSYQTVDWGHRYSQAAAGSSPASDAVEDNKDHVM